MLEIPFPLAMCASHNHFRGLAIVIEAEAGLHFSGTFAFLLADSIPALLCLAVEVVTCRGLFALSKLFDELLNGSFVEQQWIHSRLFWKLFS